MEGNLKTGECWSPSLRLRGTANPKKHPPARVLPTKHGGSVLKGVGMKREEPQSVECWPGPGGRVCLNPAIHPSPRVCLCVFTMCVILQNLVVVDQRCECY